MNDVAAVADPVTGVSVYDPYGYGGWIVVGGTSAASPFVAGLYALTGHGSDNGSLAYGHADQFFDVRTGSNGTCNGSYLCTSESGYDGPTGLGTPNATALAELGPRYHGIAGYDMLSTEDHALAFDYNGDGKQDLFLYRPGQGPAWVIRSNGDGTFAAVQSNAGGVPGIAGYDMLSTDDHALAFDYDGDRNQDLFLYRPGQGPAWVVRSNGDGTFRAVVASSTGFAGYDMLSTDDHALAFDYDGDKKKDLFLYRPGQGPAWVVRSNGDGTFRAIYPSSTGIAGYDMLSPDDQALVFEYDGDGKQDLFLYRHGQGPAWVVRSNEVTGLSAPSSSRRAMASRATTCSRPTTARSPSITTATANRTSSCTEDPGQGPAWVIRSNGDGTFRAVYASSSGIAGYDMLSPDDRALAFDYDGDGKQDLLIYRPGQGPAWVIRSNGDGTFTTVENANGHGIAGYDMMSTTDQALAFDYDGDHRSDLLLFRPGLGPAWTVRSNGDATFTRTYPVSPPSGLMATTGALSITLRWTASAGDRTFNVYRSTSSGTEALYETGVSVTSFVDTSVTSGTRYYYEVTGAGADGQDSAFTSNEVSATAHP